MQTKQQDLAIIQELEEKKNAAEKVILELQVEREKTQWNEEELKKQISDHQLKINELRLNFDEATYSSKKQAAEREGVIEQQADQINALNKEISVQQGAHKEQQDEIYMLKEKLQHQDKEMNEYIQQFKVNLERQYQDLLSRAKSISQDMQL